jgi:predicted GH43/DUF377 family glycosyl hydrolase
VGDPSNVIPYSLTRIGTLMAPDPDDPLEVEGVLNPGSGRGPDGELYLLPRLVAEGNVSRIGIARVVVEDGWPVGVERQGVVLAPDRGWERGVGNAGVEDPRIAWIEALQCHVMNYVAFGPLGPRPAIAVSDDLREWRRLGPVMFRYDDALDSDLNLFHNKNASFFSEPVIAPDGTESLAVLHRPMWDLDETKLGQGAPVPAGIEDDRLSIWISYVPLADVLEDISAITLWGQHRLVAAPQYPFEALKIGAGPPPLRVPEGWLVLHHGVTGTVVRAFVPQQNVNYAAGALLLDAEDPSRVIARTPEPLMVAETDEERRGLVPNVVFPTAIERIGDALFVFYGMADSAIGVARLERTD